jgi:hypothetical protein
MPLPVDVADRQDTWAPVWLIKLPDLNWVQADSFQLDFVATGPTSLRYASIELDTLSVPYEGRLLEPPTITRRLHEVFFGVLEVSEISLVLSNADRALDGFYNSDVRGAPLVLERYDRASDTTITEFNGMITQVGYGLGTLELRAGIQPITLFEQTLPRRNVTTTVFPYARDAGAFIPVILGNVPRVPLAYVTDDVTRNIYEYVIGEGILVVSAVYRDLSEDSLQLVTTAEYVTVVYGDMTLIRFTTRQTNFQGGLHKLWADVTGLAPERNFARAIRTLLSNTTFGFGQTIDATSFNAAEAALDAIGGLVCDGAILESRQLQDVLRELLMVRGMRLGITSTGAWSLTVDTEKTTHRLRAEDGTGDAERNLLQAGPLQRISSDDQVSTFRLRYRRDLEERVDYFFKQERVLHDRLGHEVVQEQPFIRDHTCADKVTDYLAKRLRYASVSLPVVLTQEARLLSEGDLVLITYPALGLGQTTMEVREVTKALEEISALLVGWNANIYVYTPGTLPSDNLIGSMTDYSRVPPSPVTNLSLILTHTELGADGVTYAHFHIRFTTPAINYAKAIIRIRRTGTTIWEDGVIVTYQTGVVEAHITGLIPGAEYDVTVQAVNQFDLVSAGDPLL